MNYIYIHTNKKNGKVYIGQTNRDPEKRWGKEGKGYKGCKRFYSAIKKYGWDGFEHEILISDVDDSTVNFWETYFINFYDSMNLDKGYNLTNGGKECFKLSDEVKQKISLANKRRTYSEETKQKISLARKGKPSPNKGVPMSEEQKQKLSFAKKGRMPWNKGVPMSEEQKQKMSLAKKGKKHTEETKQKMSLAHKGKTHSEESKQKMSLAQKGENHPMFGKKLSEETKQKLSLVMKGKHWKLDPITNKRIYY